jgi:hypothetical protein
LLLTTQELLNDPSNRLPEYERIEVFVDPGEGCELRARGIRVDGTDAIVAVPDSTWDVDADADSPPGFAESIRILFRAHDGDRHGKQLAPKDSRKLSK